MHPVTKMVGTLRFAHPTGWQSRIDEALRKIANKKDG